MDSEIEGQNFWSKFKNNLAELIEFLAIVGAVVVIVHFFIAEPHKVSGLSMYPNFHDGDYIITNKISFDFSNPVRGEVIILKNPRDTSQDFIKRVIGLPGEQIEVAGGHVYINGKVLAEPYLPQGLQTDGGQFLPEGEVFNIPEGQYFVMGDNRPASSDSREWGTVARNLVIGQAWFRYWPPQKVELISIEKPSA